MSTDKKNKTTPPASTPSAGDTPPDTNVNATEQVQDWALKLPKYKVPTPTGLIIVTAEILAGDPELLTMMVEKYPDCFETLPPTPESTDL